MQEKIRYTKTGKKVGVFEFEGRLHEKILLTKEQYAEHIQKKHPEITLEIIENTLKNPDIVTKKSRSKKEHFYQKKIDNINFFVVVSGRGTISLHSLSAELLRDRFMRHPKLSLQAIPLSR